MAEYEIIGMKKELYNTYEYVIVSGSNGKILFENGTSVSKPVQKYRHCIYLFNKQLNKYYEITLHESNIGGHKRHSCTVGDISVEESSENEAYENSQFVTKEIMNIHDKYHHIHDMFTGNIQADECKIECFKPNEKDNLSLLFEYSYDGDDELYPCGYATLNESLFISRAEVYARYLHQTYRKL